MTRLTRPEHCDDGDLMPVVTRDGVPMGVFPQSSDEEAYALACAMELEERAAWPGMKSKWLFGWVEVKGNKPCAVTTQKEIS